MMADMTTSFNSGVGLCWFRLVYMNLLVCIIWEFLMFQVFFQLLGDAKKLNPKRKCHPMFVKHYTQGR